MIKNILKFAFVFIAAKIDHSRGKDISQLHP